MPPAGVQGGGGVQALPQALPRVLDAEVVEARQAALPAGEGDSFGQPERAQGGKQDEEPPVA